MIVIYVRYSPPAQKKEKRKRKKKKEKPLHFFLLNKGRSLGFLLLVSKSSELLRHNFDLPQYSFVLSLRLSHLKKNYIIMATKWLPHSSSNHNYLPWANVTYPSSGFLWLNLDHTSPPQLPPQPPTQTPQDDWGFGEATFFAESFSCSWVSPAPCPTLDHTPSFSPGLLHMNSLTSLWKKPHIWFLYP